MKKLLFILFASPLLAFAQDCKVVASTGNYQGTATIPAAESGRLRELTVLNTCKDGKTYVISSFEFTSLAPGAESPTSHKCQGPAFTDAIKIACRQATAGTKLVFDPVKVKDADGAEKTIPGLTLTVK